MNQSDQLIIYNHLHRIELTIKSLNESSTKFRWINLIQIIIKHSFFNEMLRILMLDDEKMLSSNEDKLLFEDVYLFEWSNVDEW